MDDKTIRPLGGAGRRFGKSEKISYRTIRPRKDGTSKPPVERVVIQVKSRDAG